MRQAVMYLAHAQILRRMKNALDQILTENANTPNDVEKCAGQGAKP